MGCKGSRVRISPSRPITHTYICRLLQASSPVGPPAPSGSFPSVFSCIRPAIPHRPCQETLMSRRLLLLASLALPVLASAAEPIGQLHLPSFTGLQSKASEVVDITLGAWPLA